MRKWAGEPAEPRVRGQRSEARLPTSDLETARQLADAGKLTEAAAICESHLQTAGPSAHAYYLLGLVRDADGDATAMDYYRKAIYLEPNHYESLLQMSLLLEKNGDASGARTLKRRAGRVQQQAGGEL